MLDMIFKELIRVENLYDVSRTNNDDYMCRNIMREFNDISIIIQNNTYTNVVILYDDFNEFFESLDMEIIDIIRLWETSRYTYLDDEFIYFDCDGNICTANPFDLYDYYEIDSLLECYNLDNNVLEEILNILKEIK